MMLIMEEALECEWSTIGASVKYLGCVLDECGTDVAKFWRKVVLGVCSLNV